MSIKVNEGYMGNHKTFNFELFSFNSIVIIYNDPKMGVIIL